MAAVAVQILLNRLVSLIEEEGKLLGGVGRDINEIKDDLETMRAFLQDADSRSETDQGVKTWVKQVREVAYDTEDVLDEFLLRLVRPHRNRIFDSLLHKLHYIKHLNTRHRLANEVLNIKARLKAISERRQAFSFTHISEGMITETNTRPDAWYDPRIASLYIDEAEIVGIEVSKNILVTCLTEGKLKLTIISVVGMGGLGKTTLVKKVYDSQIVNRHFDCHVWITVSKSHVIRELLRTTIKKVLKVTKEQAPEMMDAMMDNNELIEVLKNQLHKKRYVIIFDDIWDINVWEAMKFAFPNCDCGSRIIFTTRTNKVSACSSYVHNLEPLNEQDAWRLFCLKAFGSSHDSRSCPEELEELSRNILKKCDGLPLAIVLIGGLLARKPKTILEWKNVHDSVGAEMRNNYDLESLGRILLLSYNNLPNYLKPCFMYLSMFPEDYFIRRMTLIQMWIAEGFIEDKAGVTMEVVAGDYINELISRSMIQIAELNKCDEVKSCRIHDLMRETIQSKCKEECFTTTMVGSQGMAYLNEKARRISIFYNSTGENNYNYSMVSRCSNIRSLMVFQLDETPRSYQRTFFNAFRLLRVLDLEGADLIEFPAELVELIHLRYLSLRSTKITVLPKSVGKLKNLETLDLKETGVSELPVEILKLQRLRHLLVYRSSSAFNLDNLTSNRCGVSVPTGKIGNLTCLQELSYLDVQHQVAHDGGIMLKELGMLTQLRRLGIMNLRSKDGSDLCVALEKMKHLHSLEIERSTITNVYKEEKEKEKEEFLELESLISPPQLLCHLYLNGRLRRLPVWIANSLWNLTSLGLMYSGLSCEEDDPLKAFQHLPNLMYLYLNQVYDGEEICCSEVSGYKKLKILFLWKMEGLKRVRFMEGSMPVLRVLQISDCPALEMVPHGIEHLTGLQELNLLRVNTKLVERIRKRMPRSSPAPPPPPPPPPQGGEAQLGEGGGEDCWKVHHIPKIILVYHDNTQGRYAYEDLNHFSLYSDDDDDEEDNSQITVEELVPYNEGRNL